MIANLVRRAPRPRYNKAGKDLIKDEKKQQARAARQQVRFGSYHDHSISSAAVQAPPSLRPGGDGSLCALGASYFKRARRLGLMLWWWWLGCGDMTMSWGADIRGGSGGGPAYRRSKPRTQ
eukprot:COSAG01_NODE_5103_length_4481_cov_13.715883_10_plen_121_part_00